MFFLLILFCICCCICVYFCLKRKQKLKHLKKKFFKDSDDDITEITNRISQLEITTTNLMHAERTQPTNPFTLPQESPQPSASANPFKSLLEHFSPWKSSPTSSLKLRNISLDTGDEDDISQEIFSV